MRDWVDAALFDHGHLHDCAGVVLHRCKGFFAGGGWRRGIFYGDGVGLSGWMVGGVRGVWVLGVSWVNLGGWFFVLLDLAWVNSWGLQSHSDAGMFVHYCRFGSWV